MIMIGPLIYTLCALTCAGCALLLWRGYRRSRQRLLFWSALCFAIMAVSNVILVMDLVIFPDLPLLLSRSIVNQVAVLVLLYGLVFESD